jgi:hypothetical protein
MFVEFLHGRRMEDRPVNEELRQARRTIQRWVFLWALADVGAWFGVVAAPEQRAFVEPLTSAVWREFFSDVLKIPTPQRIWLRMMEGDWPGFHDRERGGDFDQLLVQLSDLFREWHMHPRGSNPIRALLRSEFLREAPSPWEFRERLTRSGETADLLMLALSQMRRVHEIRRLLARGEHTLPPAILESLWTAQSMLLGPMSGDLEGNMREIVRRFDEMFGESGPRESPNFPGLIETLRDLSNRENWRSDYP